MLRSFPSRTRLLAATALCLVAPPPLAPQSRADRDASAARAPSPWEQAERGREELEAASSDGRTRAAYARVMDNFRAIYHDNPGDLHAAASVYAVAELLAEQGRSLHDRKSLLAAAGQYEFLRAQYPGSSLRIASLLAEAQIEGNDLHDDAAARERYRLLLKQYPHSEQAEEARAGLDGIASGRSRVAANRATEAASAAIATTPALSAADARIVGDSVMPSSAQTADQPAGNRPSHPAADPQVHDSSGHGLPAQGSLAQVKSIRHWSTPTYTRVAIDLGDSITYEAARVPNPDRIYFDLHNTQLAPELVAKSFSVTDDGFLRKIRTAQFSGNMTRIVLDVNDVSEYSAFLLPNPYRLIIDIHGGSRTTMSTDTPTVSAHAGNAAVKVQAVPPPVAGSGSDPASRSNSSLLPSNAPTSARVTPAASSMVPKGVPNTIAVRSANSTEVASLSAQPGRVDATTRPTSRPISAVVAGGVSEQAALIAPGARREALPDDTAVGDALPARAASPTSVAGSGAAGPGAAGLGAAGPGAASSASARPAKAAVSAVPAASLPERRSGANPPRAATPNADGETSLVRALGLKIGRIAIDAGHGGHDSGTLGVDGIEEKDVVLDVALRLGKLLHDRLGAEIVYTRSDDTFVPLETRTAIANKAQADLFLSIHANSSPDESARGVETYYLNFTSSPDALETAARENAVSNQSIHQLSDLVKKITLRDKIDESREFASDVEQSLYAGLARGNDGLKNRGIKKAPFVVLIGANMPSILAEISFVTNSRDAEQLRQPEYRQRVAESLYKGVAKYEAGLGGTRSPTLRASAGTK